MPSPPSPIDAVKTVVIDATPLRGSSGFRGIGRFIYDLLHGLAAVRGHWGGLAIEAITDLDPRGPRRTADLAAAAEELYAVRGSLGKVLVHARRLLLDRAARGADLLHLTEALGTPIERSLPRVVTCHDLIPLRMPEQYLPWGPKRVAQKHVERMRYRAASRVVAISNRTRDDLVELLEQPPASIDVVPNGIDLANWSPVAQPDDRARLDALGAPRTPYVVYVGAYDDRKDVPAMLRAVEEARRTTEIELVWAGHFDQRERMKLRAYLSAQGVLAKVSNVRFVGFVTAEDLAALYRGAVAHLFLSRLEGFGLSVAEAMACGCPVVVVRGSGSDDVAGEAGIVIDPGDVRAAAEAIARLAHDQAERTSRHDAGIARAARFGRQTMARGYLETWRKVLSPE
jgi:glycosyltransferase involved in cell wall biosynthesis